MTCLLPSPARADTLGDALDHILSIPALKGGIVGAVVQRVGDGQILYTREADRRLMPASSRKLFTSAAALEVLGTGSPSRPTCGRRTSRTARELCAVTSACAA